MGILRSLAKKVLGKSEPVKVSGGAPVSAAVPSSGPSSGPTSGSASGSAAPVGSGTEKPWYLDGTNDGWDTTDVTQDAGQPAGSGAPVSKDS